MTSYCRYQTLGLSELVEQLSKWTSGSIQGKDEIHLLQSFILVRATEMVTRQLAETSNSETKNAEAIKDQIAALTSNLAKANTNLQTASSQSSRLSGRLNLLTAALVFAAILTAGATIFQSIEEKRQADLLERQLQLQTSTASSARQPADTRVTRPARPETK